MSKTPDQPHSNPGPDAHGPDPSAWTSADESLFRSLHPPPPESEEELFARLDRFESGPFTTHLSLLEQRGYVFPPPEEIDDESLHRELWRLIHALAEIHVLIEGDGHLNDRDLYALLWRDRLREPVADLTDDPYGAWHLECHPEYDTLAYAQYYGLPEDREQYAADHGLPAAPESLPLPHDRSERKPEREDLLPPLAEGEEDEWMDVDLGGEEENEEDDGDPPGEGEDWKKG